MISRRDFLTYASLIATSSAIYSHPAKLLAKAMTSTTPHLIVGTDKKICSINLAELTETISYVGFRPHSILQDPQHLQRIWSMEKWGTHAAEINITTSKVRPIRAPANMQFAGHGFISPAGDIFYASVADTVTGQGLLIGYNTTTYKVVLQEHITPGSLHDCHVEDNKTLLVASGGTKFVEGINPAYGPWIEPSAIIQLDINNYKVLNKFRLPDEDQGIGHFATTRQGSIIALSAPNGRGYEQSGFIYFLPNGAKEFKKVILPDEVIATLQKEILSVAIDEDSQVALVTNPHSSPLIFIDVAKGEYIKHLFNNSFPNVSFDKVTKKFLVGGRNLSSIDIRDWSVTRVSIGNAHQPTPYGKFHGSLYNGSHSAIIVSA